MGWRDLCSRCPPEGVEEMFNAIKYTEELKRAGFTPDQADTSMKVLIDVMNENFATKHDIQELRLATQHDIHELKSELNAKIDSVKSELNAKIDSVKSELNAKIDSVKNELILVKNELNARFDSLEYRLTIKLGTITVIAIGATATLLKLIESSH
jgi:hypothetical protein